MKLKKMLYQHREKIIYSGLILGGVVTSGFFSTTINQLKAGGIEGKYFIMGGIGLSLYVFNAFYSKEFLKKQYDMEQTISNQQYFVPSQQPVRNEQEQYQPLVQRQPQQPQRQMAQHTQQHMHPHDAFAQFDSRVTKENSPKHPPELMEKEPSIRFNVPDLSDGIKTLTEMRSQRETKYGRLEDMDNRQNQQAD